MRGNCSEARIRIVGHPAEAFQHESLGTMSFRGIAISRNQAKGNGLSESESPSVSSSPGSSAPFDKNNMISKFRLYQSCGYWFINGGRRQRKRSVLKFTLGGRCNHSLEGRIRWTYDHRSSDHPAKTTPSLGLVLGILLYQGVRM
jgi:hypothetical protein